MAVRTSGAVVAAALALGACGQKGPLYLPESQGGPAARAASAPAVTTTSATSATPASAPSAPASTPAN
jgi:predicted small lipoprotein YifL